MARNTDRGKKTRYNTEHESEPGRQSLLRSFANAWNGIMVCVVEERNINIHIFAAVMVLIFGNILDISVTEWCICFVLFGLIMGMELMNTAVESVVDGDPWRRERRTARREPYWSLRPGLQ